MPDFLSELKFRAKNRAIPDPEYDQYVTSALREVSEANYPHDVWIEQVLDTALYKMAIDNKLPEIQSSSQNGLNISYSSNDPERFRRRITERRHAQIINSVGVE